MGRGAAEQAWCSPDRSAGRVVGTVTDSSSGVGAADVILRIADRVAVTDLRGAFLFPDLPPGTYYVSVDTSRMREERLVAGRAPLAVQVEASRDAGLDIRLVAPARVSGIIKHERTADDGTLVPADPLPDLLVEIRRDGEVRKALTDREGAFAFSGLPPGQWRLHLSTDRLPAYTTFTENDLDIDLDPGEAVAVETRLVPVRREMKIVDEGEIIEEEALEEEAPVEEAPVKTNGGSP